MKSPHNDGKNKKEEERIWEKYEEERSSFSSGHKIEKSSGKKPPPFQKSKINKVYNIKKNYMWEKSNSSGKQGDKIIPVEELVEEIIDVASYGYFKDI